MVFIKKYVVGALLVCTCYHNAQAQANTKKLAATEQIPNIPAVLARAKAAYKPTAQAIFKTNTIVYDTFKMPFDFITYGTKPANGWPLYISLHGGGSATAEVNDEQWKNQHNLYHPETGIYIVPRAPTNTWNLWHENHIDAMLEKMIKAFIVSKGADANRIYILGYSAGGDGVYQLATRMADYWGAAAMMAGHPGDANAINLRNLPFGIYVGGTDSAYNRNKLASVWSQQLDSLENADADGYVHDLNIFPGLPHWMNSNDTMAIPWLAGYSRNPLPKKVAWVQDDYLRKQFYWLGTDIATTKAGNSAIAGITGNTIDILQNDFATLYIYLNDSMINLDTPVTIKSNGNTLFSGVLNRQKALMEATANQRLDLAMVFSVKVVIKNGMVEQ